MKTGDYLIFFENLVVRELFKYLTCSSVCTIDGIALPYVVARTLRGFHELLVGLGRCFTQL